MDTADLIARLADHRTIGDAPADELAWLAAHGSLRRYARGDVISRKGEVMTHLLILLAGHMAIDVDRGLGRRRVLDWKTGDVAGTLPFSRMTGVPGVAMVIEPLEALAIDKAHFPELVRECPHVTAALVHVMVDRARAFTSSELQDDKMASLGRMAAGLAHELNNPAAAAARGARLLDQVLDDAERASQRLSLARLTETHFAAIDRARERCLHAPPGPLSPIERADREDALASWLDAHEVDPGLAAALVDSAVTSSALDELAGAVDGPGLGAALGWIAACCSVRVLMDDIRRATTRIHDLVGAVKRFTYMDRTQAAEAVDIEAGLQDTMTLLRHKARGKAIDLRLDVEPALPPVRAIGSDLNQIWMNLIDNAIDAVGEGGRVDLTATHEPGAVVVRVIDDGPGVPEEIRDRIFDPFFTTKPVGQGTGLGLDITQRLVRRNGGDVALDSHPGRTVFRVVLPIHEATGAG